MLFHEGVALEVVVGLMTASANHLTKSHDNGHPDDRLLQVFHKSLLGELFLHKLFCGLYTLLVLAYTIFICTKRTMSRIEIGILGLMVAKVVFESMTIAYYTIWRASGRSPDLIYLWAGIF